MMPLVSVVWTVLVNGLARLRRRVLHHLDAQRRRRGRRRATTPSSAPCSSPALAALISIPIGLLTAIYLVEYGEGRAGPGITFLVDVMTGIPSIVAGLFAYALFALFFGPGIRMGIVRRGRAVGADDPGRGALHRGDAQLVPNELREASYALGVPKWRTIVKVVLPTSIAGITTGITLAIARVIGETAPLLITAGFTDEHQLQPVRRPDDDAAGLHLHPVRAPGRPARGRSSSAPGPPRWC